MGGVVAGGIVRAQAWERIDLPRAHSAGQVDGYRRGEPDHFAFVVAPIHCKAEERVTQRVFVNGVEVHEIRFVSEVLASETGGCGRNGDLVREVAAECAASGGRMVWFADSREQQKTRVVKRPGGEEDKRGGLKDFLPGGVHVADAASSRLGSRD